MLSLTSGLSRWSRRLSLPEAIALMDSPSREGLSSGGDRPHGFRGTSYGTAHQLGRSAPPQVGGASGSVPADAAGPSHQPLSREYDRPPRVPHGGVVSHSQIAVWLI